MTSGVPWQIKGVSRRHARPTLRSRAPPHLSRRMARSVILDLALGGRRRPEAVRAVPSDPRTTEATRTRPPSATSAGPSNRCAATSPRVSLMLREDRTAQGGRSARKGGAQNYRPHRVLRVQADDGAGLASVVRGLAETPEALRAVMPAEKPSRHSPSNGRNSRRRSPS